MGGLKKATRTTIGFMGQFKQQPNYDPDPLELSESDVVWSSSPPTSPLSTSIATPALNSPTHTRPEIHQFRPTDKMGLSAALSSDSPPPLIGRKPSSAARAVPPVTTPKSGSNSDNSSGSGPKFGRFHQSAPVNIPVWPRLKDNSKKLVRFDEDVDDDEEEAEEEEREGRRVILPPHEIIAARSQTVAFSVFEGAGRTLKGRDLRRVRNAVFQKTGFLD